MIENSSQLLLLYHHIPICAYPRVFTDFRFIAVSVSSVFAVFGVICNLILVSLFSKFPNPEPTLAMLALLDGLLCFCYIVLFGVEAWAHYLTIKFLYDLRFSYVLYTFSLSRAVQLGIPAMLILTSLRRWAEISNRSLGIWRIVRSNQGKIGLILLFLSCTRAIPMLSAGDVYWHENCTDYFRTKEIWPSIFGLEKSYRQFEVFMTMLQVFGSFAALLILNSIIVCKLHSTRIRKQSAMIDLLVKISNGTDGGEGLAAKRQSKFLAKEIRRVVRRERNAISTLAIIVCTYLLCNSLHILLTSYETWGKHIIKKRHQNQWNFLYTVGIDVLNFLFMFCSAIRLLIYYVFDPDMKMKLHMVFGCYIARNNSVSSINHQTENDHQSDQV